ncbi:MAG: ATPase [Gaiellaceae bacterium]|jgi:Ca2+-transporting ATPase|nr:MAG: ATPase [Gaiellaceae bacterium]
MTEALRRAHTLEVEEVARVLGTDPIAGLTPDEAARRLAAHGPNEIATARGVSPWGLLLAQFRNVLILILLVAVGLSLAVGHEVEAIVIAVIVLFAVLLGFAQEYRAERAIEALRAMAAPLATVVRAGVEEDVPAREVVPGDVVLLRAGDRVPADGRLVEAASLQVEEAALTGESLPVEKSTEPLGDPELALGDRRNMVYAGTAVTYGRGRALVVATAMDTEFGSVARMLEDVESPKTPLQRNLDRVGNVLARVALLVVAVVVALGVVRGEPLVDMLIFGAALAVAVVPEALPAVVTISLTLAAQRMVRRHALIRRLAATETLGSVTVICSDKTGTLTRDEMTVRELVTADGAFTVTGAGFEPVGELRGEDGRVEPTPSVLELMRAAVLASDAHVVREDGDGAWRVRGDPTEGALVVAAAKLGLHKAELDATCPRVDEIPFTSERKRMTTLHRTPEGVVAYAKGAPEVILAACSRRLTEAGREPLADEDRREILARAQELAGQALRVLAVASKPAASRANAERDLTFLGLVGMLDPPREEAREAVAVCRQAGICPVMITGDHPLTAEAIARELGLLDGGRVVTGTELVGLDDEELAREIEEIRVFARVSPEHKLRVVTAFQANEHSVAMTGDGVNDAPALKKADIGIAMGITGTDVSKEAADMILTDDNFASIVAAVEEGRGVFANIKKYLMYLLSANLGEIGLLSGAAVLGQPLPLSAVQILYVNLATDGLPAIALGVDPPEPDLMQRPPRRRAEGIFTRPVVGLIVLGGAWSALANLLLFLWALDTGRETEEAMSLVFTSLVLTEFLKAYSYRSDRRSVLERTFANRWLNLAVAWELTLLCLVLYVPFLQHAFGTVGPSLEEWALVLAVAATIVPVLEVGKWVVRRRSPLGVVSAGI